MKIVSRNIGQDKVTITTPTGRGSAPAAWELHLDIVRANGNGGSPPCLRTDVPCNGSTVTVETCCLPGETAEQCLARHDAAVDRVNEACGN